MLLKSACARRYYKTIRQTKQNNKKTAWRSRASPDEHEEHVEEEKEEGVVEEVEHEEVHIKKKKPPL